MLLSANEAVARGILRLRQTKWVNLLDHVRFDNVDGRPGPWMHLHSVMNKAMNGHDPQDLLTIGRTLVDLTEECLVPYEGPLPGSAEWLAAEAAFLVGWDRLEATSAGSTIQIHR